MEKIKPFHANSDVDSLDLIVEHYEKVRQTQAAMLEFQELRLGKGGIDRFQESPKYFDNPTLAPRPWIQNRTGFGSSLPAPIFQNPATLQAKVLTTPKPPESLELTSSDSEPALNSENILQTGLNVLDKTSFAVSSVGALLALTAVGSLLFGAVTVPAAITAVLASPFVDAGLLLSGLWLFGRSLPHAADSMGRLSKGNYSDWKQGGGDILNVLMLGVSVTGIGTHLFSWARGLQHYFRALPQLSESYSAKEALKYALREADYTRRISRDLLYQAQTLSEGRNVFNLGLATFLKTSHSVLKYSPVVSAGYVTTQTADFLEKRKTDPEASALPLVISMGHFLISGITAVGPYAAMKLYEKSRTGQITRPLRTEEMDEDLLIASAHQEKRYDAFAKTELKSALEAHQQAKLQLKQAVTDKTSDMPSVKQAWANFNQARSSKNQAIKTASELESEMGHRLRKAFPQLPETKKEASHPTLPSRIEIQQTIEKRLQKYDQLLKEVEQGLQTGTLKTVRTLAEEASPQRLTTPILSPVSKNATLQMAARKMNQIQGALSAHGVSSLDRLYQINPAKAAQIIHDLSIDEYRLAYAQSAQEKRLLRAETVVKIILADPDWKNSALFPRSGDKAYEQRLLQWARESDLRWDRRTPLQDESGKVWDGIPFGLKDLYANHDGKTTLGSVSSGVVSTPSYISQQMRKFGGLEIPVGATAGGLGGTARDVRGRYLPNPYPMDDQTVTIKGKTYHGTDLGGSSGPSVHVLSKLPFSFGTDTGGSCKVPAAVVKDVSALVPSQDHKTRTGMFPFDPNKDHTGIFAKRDPDLKLVYQVAQALNPSEWKIPVPTPKRPVIAYLEDDLNQAPAPVVENFRQQMETYRASGYQVVEMPGQIYRQLIGEIQSDLYAPSSYPNAVFAAMNPKQSSNWGEPPRYGMLLDANFGRDRFPKAEASLKYYPEIKNLVTRLQKVLDKIVGEDAVLAFTAPQRIPSEWLLESHQGRIKPRVLLGPQAGEALDRHDLNTMPSNFNPHWETFMPPASRSEDIGNQVLFMGPSEAARSLAAHRIFGLPIEVRNEARMVSFNKKEGRVEISAEIR